MINVAIVDDQPLIAEGLKRILDGYDEINVIAVGHDGNEAVEIVRSNKVNVLLMDIRMPEKSGVEAVKDIRSFNNTKIIMLTTFDDEEYIIKAMAYKADGYLFKDINYDKLVETVKNVYNGQYVMEPKVAQVLAQNIDLNNNDKVYKKFEFTEREKEVADMIKEGFSNKQIARALFISEGTVKNYVSSIYTKAEVKNRIEFVNKMNN